jgi:NADH dehydrogenase FAD-containing subunit
MMRQLVLLGSGPAHLRLLARLAKQLPPGATTGIKITLISRNQRPIDAALSREFVAGRVKLDACLIDLEPLVQATKVQWLEVQAVALDATAQALLLADGQEIRYDWLSINQEPVQNRERTEQQLPGASANGLFVHPSSVFCKLWPSVLALAASKAQRVAVICDNAHTPEFEIAGIEMALAIRQALPHCAVSLITGGALLASASNGSLRQVLVKTLKTKRITVLADAALAIQPGQIALASGASLACDVPVLATSAHAPPFALASGLALDANGFVAVDCAQRSTSHPNVLAVPDVDLHGDELARALTGMTGLPFTNPSDRRSKLMGGLQFVSSQDGQAITNWGGYSARGRLAAWLKHRIDRSRMASYQSQ